MTYALVAVTLTSGLLAGLFHAFSAAVMPALRGADDAVFTDTMRRINRAILNGWFAVGFAGTPLLGVAAAVWAWRAGSPVLTPVLAGLALYAVQFGITAAVNVPLNDRLEADADRVAFEGRWVRANNVRTWVSSASFASFCWALSQV